MIQKAKQEAKQSKQAIDVKLRAETELFKALNEQEFAIKVR